MREQDDNHIDVAVGSKKNSRTLDKYKPFKCRLQCHFQTNPLQPYLHWVYPRRKIRKIGLLSIVIYLLSKKASLIMYKNASHDLQILDRSV